MEDVPDTSDIYTMKRSALQKLCKRYGIKANIKNSEMIAALTQLKEEKNSGGFDSSITDCADPDRPAITPPSNKHLQLSPIASPMIDIMDVAPVGPIEDGSDVFGAVASSPVIVTNALPPVTNDMTNEQTKPPAVLMMEEKDEQELSTVKGDKDELQDMSTNDNYTPDLHVIKTAESDSTTEETKEDNTVAVEMMEMIDIEELELNVTPLKEEETIEFKTNISLTEYEDKCGEETSPLLSSDGNHNSTFIIEPLEEDMPDQAAALSDSLSKIPENASSPRGVWGLRQNESKELCNTPLNKVSSVSTANTNSPLLNSVVYQDKENTSNYHDEIMDILNSRVKERMADPSYSPLAENTRKSGSLNKSSQNMTPIAKKFKMSHQREFNKMESISEVAERRKRVRIDDSQTQSCKKIKTDFDDKTNHRSSVKRITTSESVVRTKPKIVRKSNTKKPPFKF